MNPYCRPSQQLLVLVLVEPLFYSLCFADYNEQPMPKERGKEWKHVKVLKTNKNNHLVECSYCQKQFWVGSGSRIRAHLGVETINGVTRCEKVPENVVTSLSKAESKKFAETAEAARKRSIDAKFSSASLTGEGSTSAVKQPKITAMCSKRQKSEVDEAVARMCYSTGVSFNVVNNKHFREMCKKIGDYGPSYQVPSDYPIRTTLLEQEYSKVCRRVDEFHADHLTRTGGTIVSDGWSDAQRRPLLNFLLVTPSGEFRFVQKCGYNYTQIYNAVTTSTSC